MKTALFILAVVVLLFSAGVMGYALKMSLHARSVGMPGWYAAMITAGVSLAAAIFSVVVVARL